MLDLETMGTAPGCVILSIGAVRFDKTGLGDEFYSVISQQSCKEAGLVVDPDTAAWWARQSQAAKKVIEISNSSDSLPLADGLDDFAAFVKKFTKTKVWGNGADFDNPILSAAFRAAGRAQPWQAYNGRCYRTLKNLVNGPKITRVGTYHNALDDAKSQALHAIELIRIGHASWE